MHEPEYKKRLIIGNLKGKNQQGDLISYGNIGKKIEVFENEKGLWETKNGEVFTHETIDTNTIEIEDKDKKTVSINDIVINVDDNTLDLKSYLPDKLKELLQFLGTDQDEIPKGTYPKIMDAQDIINFYGKPILKVENKFLYDRMIDLFGADIDGNSDGTIGNGLTPTWVHPPTD